MSEIERGSVPAGATHVNTTGEFYRPANNEKGGEFFDDLSCEWRMLRDSFDDLTSFAFVRPLHAAWPGEGLPPVGAAVECKCLAKTKARDWFPAEVKYISPYTVVMTDYSTDELDGEFVAHPATLIFRMRKTPEQLAAEQRQQAITSMADDIAVYNGSGTGSLANWLYGKGYRKQEDQEKP